MSTGHHTEANLFGSSEPWAKTFLAHPVDHKPGTFFLYNTPASHMLSEIVQKVTGTTVLDYLRPRLFDPLGITDPVWESSPQGVTIGGFGLSLRTREIARFGELYLRKGEWEGRRLLPAGWAEAATLRQTSTGSSPNSDWDQGYGYQFWRSRHGNYRGDGAFGQFCIVVPELDAVVAITSGVRDMQAVMNLVWAHLLPAMKPSPLPADTGAQSRLERTLSGLRVRVAEGSASPAAGAASRVYTFEPNDQRIEAVALEPGAGGRATLVVRTGGAEQRIAIGAGEWTKGRLADGPWPGKLVAASGAWTAPDTYLAKLCFYETPFTMTVTLRFAGEQLTYDSELNVNFGPTRRPQLVGRAR
jgi:hypothetical protein